MTMSLRRRLFAWIAVAIVGMGIATTLLSFWLSFEDANDLQDAQLQQVTALIAAQPTVVAPSHFHPRDSEDAETHFVVHVLGAHLVDANPQVDVFLPESLPDGLRSIEESGFRWRVMVSRNVTGQRFAVAQRQTIRDEVAQDSALLTLLPMLVLVPLLLLIVHMILRQGFARMAKLSQDVDAVDDGRLAALDATDVPSEALPLVLAVNRLVKRLGGVLDQQRRMVADAAHELRTPVAATRVQADNLGHAALGDDARERLGELQHGLGRISELIEQLLDLARVQVGSAVHDQTFSFDDVVRNAIEESLPMAQRRGIDLGTARLDAAALRGSPSHAFALVRNAVDNAVRYSTEGGTVDVNVEVQGGVAVLTVEDCGPGIHPDLRERVFEPFYRILGSHQPGSGLGLAIVRSAAQALGGRIQLGERADGRSGLRFTYTQRVA